MEPRHLKHFHQTSPDFFSFWAAVQQINTHWSVIKHVLHCVPFTWQQGEGDGVDAVVLGGAGALGVGDVHLEFHRFLENRGTGCGLVLRPEAGLRDDAVAQTGDLRGSRLWVSRNTDKQLLHHERWQHGRERKRQEQTETVCWMFYIWTHHSVVQRQRRAQRWRWDVNGQQPAALDAAVHMETHKPTEHTPKHWSYRTYSLII